MPSEGDGRAGVAVLGAGPAGCAAALRLRQLGHRVVLFHRPPVARAHAIESLPESVLPWLEQLGLRAGLGAAGWGRHLPTSVSWAGAAHPPSVEAQPSSPTLHVQRPLFDAMLLQACRVAGVSLRYTAARQVHPLAQGWCVHGADGQVTEAALVVDGRGRRAGHARAPATVAVGATWEVRQALEPRSWVEAIADAWLWATPVGDKRLHVMVFADAQRLAGVTATQRAQLHQKSVAQSKLLTPLLAGAACGPISVCDATLRCVADPVDEHGRLQVGDAAFTVDPLSSQGVAAALRQGVQAAACVHTALGRPEDAAWARAFHRGQVQRHFQRHLRMAQGFYSAALAQGGGAFWAARAGPQQPAQPPQEGMPALTDEVQFDPRTQWRTEPVLENGWVVPRTVIDHPALDSPLPIWGSRCAGDLGLLAQGTAMPVHALLDALRDRVGPQAAASMWATLWRAGILSSSGVPAPVLQDVARA